MGRISSLRATIDVPSGARTLAAIAVAVAAAIAIMAAAGAAHASAASACPNAALRTGASASLPDCRGYEQVTPVDKNLNDVDNGNKGIGLGVSIGLTGDGVAFCSASSFSDQAPTLSAICANYVSRRTATGWRTTGAVPPYCGHDHDGNSSNAKIVAARAYSRDVDAAVIEHAEGGSCSLLPLSPNAPQPSENLYRRTFGDPPAFSLLNPHLGVSSGYSTPVGTVEGGSDDLSHVIYASTGQQTPDAPVGNFDKLYDWHDGQLDLVSIDPSGVPFTTASSGVYSSWSAHGVSSTGDRVLFQNPAPGTSSNVGSISFGCPSGACALYIRAGGHTDEVSKSECTVSCGTPAPAFFLRATRDLSQVFFVSESKLTDDADTGATGYDLYRYTPSEHPDADQNLVLLSEDHEPADGTGAQVQQVLGTNQNGDVVYFVGRGQIVAGAPTAPTYKIYRWQWNGGAPTVDYLGGLSWNRSPVNWFPPVSNATPFADQPSAGAAGTAMDRRVTPDGKYLLLQTTDRLDPAADTDTDIDQYRWDAQDGWRCVSCQPAGTPSAGASYVYSTTEYSMGDMRTAHISMSDDGQRVFFATSDALVPTDTNGVEDVYEWDGRKDAFHLLSSGTGTDNSVLLGATPTGGDVFILTRDRLVGWDIDGYRDIYDVRVDGGFPEPVSPPECSGDGCQGPVSLVPTPPTIGSRSIVGDGNVPFVPRTVPASVRVAKARTARGAVVRLHVRVPAAGRITVAGPRTRRSSRAASKAGRYTVRVALKPRARKRLRRLTRQHGRHARRALHARVRVRYRSEDGRSVAKTVVVTFRQPRARHIHAKRLATTTRRANATRKGGR